MHRLLNAAASLGFLASLGAAILLYRNDLREREPALRHVAAFGLQQRRPEVVNSVGLALSPDWAAEIVGDAALRDAFEGVDLTNLTPEARIAWIESASRIEDEVRSTHVLLLDAIAARPGWPLHQSMLGQVILAENHLSTGSETRSNDLWLRPLSNAAEGAPAVLEVWQSLAAGYLQNWPVLTPAQRAEVPRVLRNAFADADFVKATFGPTAGLVGNTMAIGCLPESAKSLLAAFEYCAAENDVSDAIALRGRWEQSEWNERVRDLEAIERHFHRGDTDDVRTLCNQWIRRHSVWDFDSPAAHAQAARILELWPGEGTDPIAEIARYVWTRNRDGERFAPLVAKTLDATPNVSKQLIAEVKLAAGEVGEAERIARSAEDANSVRWSSFQLALVRHQIASGNVKGAEETLSHVSPAVLQTHEALLTRSALAAARGEKSDAIVFPEIERTTLSPCAAEAQIPVRGWRDWQTVRIRLIASQPTIIDLGANGARAATLLIDSDRVVTFRLFGFAEQTLWFKRLSGGGEICASVERSVR
jgi:hypothetical protein